MGRFLTDHWNNAADKIAAWRSRLFCVEPFQDFRRNLAAYVFTDLAENERRDLEFHLEQCHHCSRKVRDLRVLNDGIRGMCAAGLGPSENGESILSAGSLRRWARRRSRERRAVQAAAAVAWLLVVAAAFWGGTRIGGRAPDSRSPAYDRLLLSSGASVAARLIIEEPLLDVRTSFGPALPGVAMLFHQGFSPPPVEDDAPTVEDALRSEIAAGTRDARVAVTAAMIAAFRHDMPEARESMSLALSLAGPEDRATLLDAGVVAFLLSEFDTAESCFTRALDMDPSSAEASYDLARLYEVAGRATEAAEAWTDYIEIDPSSPWAELAQVRILDSLNRTDGGEWPPWKHGPFEPAE